MTYGIQRRADDKDLGLLGGRVGWGGEAFQEIIILHPTMATVGYFIIVYNTA